MSKDLRRKRRRSQSPQSRRYAGGGAITGDRRRVAVPPLTALSAVAALRLPRRDLQRGRRWCSPDSERAAA